jgi:tight adherence protein B
MAPDSERKMRRRIDRITSPNAAPKGEESQVQSVRRSTKDSSIAGLDRLIKKLVPNVGVMRKRLARSGWPLKIGEYLLICLVLAGVSGFGLSVAAELPTVVYPLVGIVVGAGLPHFILQRRIAKRIRKFTMLLPDALDLIVRGIRSGLPASEALRSIGDEMEDPIGIEFRQVTDQMKIGVNLDDAMWATAKKLDIPEFNFLVISLSIQQETGGNLAEILEKLSDMVRRREQMRLKVKAMSSEARASAMIIGALPFIMCGVISFVNPGYMSALFTDPRGWVMIGVGLTSLSVGMFVMSKMVKFEI